MGFWDSVKSVALSVKCFTGWHEGEYEHIKGKPKCFLGKTCPDYNQFIFFSSLLQNFNNLLYIITPFFFKSNKNGK